MSEAPQLGENRLMFASYEDGVLRFHDDDDWIRGMSEAEFNALKDSLIFWGEKGIVMKGDEER